MPERQSSLEVANISRKPLLSQYQARLELHSRSKKVFLLITVLRGTLLLLEVLGIQGCANN